MTENESNNIRICLRCINIFQIDQDSPVCPSCGTQFNEEEYKTALRYAKDAVYFGYYYRNYYEKQLRDKGKVEKHGFISPPEPLLSWIALVALSGIIGSISYDLFTAVIKKIVSQFQQHPNKEELPGIHIFEDQDEAKKFMIYLGHYYAGLRDIDEDARNAIYHEMIVHESERIIEEEPDLKFPADMNYLKEKAANRVIDKINFRISEKELKEIWDQVELSA
ncbi:hypothetical protein ACFL2E_04430 [Thermodesulfobacteriota bacterium]